MSRCAFCHRDYCNCGYMDEMHEMDRQERALEEAAWVAHCEALGLMPYAYHRDLDENEAREELERREQARRDAMED